MANPLVSCAQCGTQFRKRDRYAFEGINFYCSVECYDAGRPTSISEKYIMWREATIATQKYFEPLELSNGNTIYVVDYPELEFQILDTVVIKEGAIAAKYLNLAGCTGVVVKSHFKPRPPWFGKQMPLYLVEVPHPEIPGKMLYRSFYECELEH